MKKDNLLILFLTMNVIVLLISICTLTISDNHKEELNQLKEELREEKLFANYSLELLHYVWQNNPDYWYNTLSKTKEYNHLDSVYKEIGWEDFYCIWEEQVTDSTIVDWSNRPYEKYFDY